MWETLIDHITDILKNNKSSNGIQEVFEYETDKFSGSPTATVTPSENESEYNTLQDNVRIYAFTVRIFVNMKAFNQKNADRILRKCVSAVLDDFDRQYSLTDLTSPTGYCPINIFALPSIWGYAEREDIYRVAEIAVRCRVSVDINAIS